MPNTKTSRRKTTSVLSGEQFLKRRFKQRKLIISPWLPTGGLALCYGGSGVGKTHVLLGASLAAATAGSFLSWSADKRYRVAYIDGEMPAQLLQVWLKEAKEIAGIKRLPRNFRIVTSALAPNGRLPNLADREAQRDFYAAICQDADLIVFDNLDSLCGSRGDMWADSLQSFVLKLRHQNKSVILAHHTAKSGQQRGSSRKLTNLDAVMRLQRPKNYSPDQGARFEIHWDKSRHFFGPDAEAFEASLVDGDWECSKPNAKQSRVKTVLDELAGGPMSNKELHRALGNNCPAAELRTILHGLEEQGAIISFKTQGAGRPATVWIRPTQN